MKEKSSDVLSFFLRQVMLHQSAVLFDPLYVNISSTVVSEGNQIPKCFYGGWEMTVYRSNACTANTTLTLHIVCNDTKLLIEEDTLVFSLLGDSVMIQLGYSPAHMTQSTIFNVMKYFHHL